MMLSSNNAHKLLCNRIVQDSLFDFLDITSTYGIAHSTNDKAIPFDSINLVDRDCERTMYSDKLIRW